jgi:hypothetical protein
VHRTVGGMDTTTGGRLVAATRAELREWLAGYGVGAD